MTASQAIAEATRKFRSAGIETPGRDARILVGAALGLKIEQLISRPEMPVGSDKQELLDSFIGRRIAREPVSRILGRRGFYGREFEISPATLDPRPDSETLIDAALELISGECRQRDFSPRILDIGTGSGCLLITLLAELPQATGLGTDIDPQALETAELNAQRHSVAARANWQLARSLNGIDEQFDLLVANPPYVPAGDIEGLEPEVRYFEPLTALDGGADGLDVYREISKGLLRVIPEGWALFEVGAGQAEAVSGLLSNIRVGAHLPDIRIFRDLNGIDRCVAWKARH